MWGKVIGTFTLAFTKLALCSVSTPINICCGSRCTNKLTDSGVENWFNEHSHRMTVATHTNIFCSKHMSRIGKRVLYNTTVSGNLKRWSRLVARKFTKLKNNWTFRGSDKWCHPWTVDTSRLLMSKRSIKKSSKKPFLHVWTPENLKQSKNSSSFHVCILRHNCFEGKFVLSQTRPNFLTGTAIT